MRRADHGEAPFDRTQISVALGHALAAQRRLDEAEQVLREAVAHDPRNAVAHSNHAALLRALGRHDAAETACRAALAVDADFVAALHTLGTICAERRRFDEAETCFVRVLAIDSQHVQALVNLASVCSASNRYDEAIALLERAVAENPRSVESHVNLAMVLADVGRTKAAVVSLRAALEIDPDHVEAWYALSAAGEGNPTGYEADRLRRLMESGKLAAEQRTKLCFVLANAAERRGSFLQAFADFQRGNALRKAALDQAGLGFDPATHTARIDALVASGPVVACLPSSGGVDDPRPIYVVGLPRSGTTLIERILDSHADVRGIGERDDVSNLAAEPNAQARAAYLASLRDLARGAEVIVDKTPFNYLHLGEIVRSVPGARIVHVRRDLRDCGWSCFAQNFVQPHAWSCDLDHIGSYVRDYRRLMDHWRAALPPGAMIEIDYEALVADPEGETRKIVAFAGLGWDPACLTFHKTSGIVRSASKWQVRRPVYGSSVGRWQPFRAFLGPLLARLG